jgi:GMP synthase (glutamine-hydrolyzing), N-terminal domain or A subunit
MKNKDKILILDFGSQYTQLIARRVREIGVFSVVKPSSLSVDKIIEMNPSGIILSGGPETVTISSSQKVDKSLLEANIPILGICYGMQTIANELSGSVVTSNVREFGHAKISCVNQSVLFNNISFDSNKLDVWMSHGDKVDLLPENFEIIASSKDCQIAGFQNEKLNIFGLQFHPEVTHTDQGKKILKNFIFEVCKCRKNWSTSDIIDSMVNSVQDKVKDEKVLLGLSGGVDSSVVAMLLHKAIKNNLNLYFCRSWLAPIRKSK